MLSRLHLTQEDLFIYRLKLKKAGGKKKKCPVVLFPATSLRISAKSLTSSTTRRKRSRKLKRGKKKPDFHNPQNKKVLLFLPTFNSRWVKFRRKKKHASFFSSNRVHTVHCSGFLEDKAVRNAISRLSTSSIIQSMPCPLFRSPERVRATLKLTPKQTFPYFIIFLIVPINGSQDCLLRNAPRYQGEH